MLTLQILHMICGSNGNNSRPKIVQFSLKVIYCQFFSDPFRVSRNFYLLWGKRPQTLQNTPPLINYHVYFCYESANLFLFSIKQTKWKIECNSGLPFAQFPPFAKSWLCLMPSHLLPKYCNHLLIYLHAVIFNHRISL